MLARCRFSSPVHTRSISLFDNVKKILGRTAPPSPLPSDASQATASEGSPTDDSAPIAKVGKINRSKVVGYNLNVPNRVDGQQLRSAVSDALTRTLGNSSSIAEEKKLAVAQSIMESTGHRIPDHVLNTARSKADITKHFDTYVKQGQGKNPVLTLDQEKLPRNVQIVL